MAYTKKQDQRDSWNRWYARNKKRHADSVALRKKRIRQALQDLKETLSCAKCGENHPSCLQFHHPDRKTKEVGVADAVSQGWSIKRILKEIEKCVVLCANCHFKIHSEI